MTGRLAQLFLQARFVVLALMAISFFSALALHRPDWTLAPMVLVCAALAWALLRYWPLALLAAVAPMPGLLWFSHSVIAHALSFALCLVMASALSHRLLRGGSEEAAFADQFVMLPALAGVVAVAFFWSVWGPRDVAAIVAASMAGLLMVPAGASLLPFGEDFFIAANRARETRGRVLERILVLIQPRWGLSLSGILLVLAVLGLFDGSGLASLADLIGVLLVALALFAATRDGRVAMAGLVVAGILLLLVRSATLPLLVFALLAIFLSRAADDGGQSSWPRVFQTHGAALAFAAAGAALASARHGDLVLVRDVLSAGVAALVFFPALSLFLQRVLPRPVLISSLYRN